jgi:hypothetical protein
MYPHSHLWHYLWIAPHALQLVVVFIMIRRKLTREFPMFLSYTIFQIVQEGGLFVLDHSSSISGSQYWNIYWTGLAISIALRFLVIREIFCHVFRPYPGLEELSKILFRWATVILLLVGVAVATYAPGSDTQPIFSGVHVVDRAVSLIQTGLLFFLFLFSSYFGLSWRSYVYGIAVGLGIFSSVSLATSAIQVRTWPAAGSYIFDFVNMATYHCCVLIWIAYLLAPEAARRTVRAVPENNLEQWNAELQRLLMQ